MLSYMLPVEENGKPPPSLHLDLEAGSVGGVGGDGDRSPASEDKSSFVSATDSRATDSDVTIMTPSVEDEPTNPPATKSVAKTKPNGHIGKHTGLKRVSFGSSKGSMVETLIYESPVLEEDAEDCPVFMSPVPPLLPHSQNLRNGGLGYTNGRLSNGPHRLLGGQNNTGAPLSGGKSSSRVRVTFFECEKPLVVNSPEPSDLAEDLDVAMASPSPTPMDPSGSPYARQVSVESGWDNPFRPDGDLSKEADELVEAIKEGKSIAEALKSPTTPSPPPGLDVTDARTSPTGSPAHNSTKITSTKGYQNDAAPPKGGGANGTTTPGAVEVQHGLVAPVGDGTQVEHVVLKKKPKCKCCVIQ